MADVENEAAKPVQADVPPQPIAVRVSGDLDIHHAEETRHTLLTAIGEAAPGAEVIIDLRYSSFCDSSGLDVLLAARKSAAESGHPLRLGAPSHQMLRLLAATGTAGLFMTSPALGREGSRSTP
ncbi:STAS domain-containing protein [Streptomyces sp. NPDC056944]|uniref:STAS domain-containing protein n=1 Tax=unclassified Streptomyces TaxID=2593676 RepID=UPI00364434E6